MILISLTPLVQTEMAKNLKRDGVESVFINNHEFRGGGGVEGSSPFPSPHLVKGFNC